MRWSPLALTIVIIVLLSSVVTIPGPFATAQEATPTIKMDTRVRYGEAGGQRLYLEVLLPQEAEPPYPAVLLFPGWGESRYAVVPEALELARAGYVAIAADYRPDLLGFIDDGQLAVRWTRANADQYQIDPDRICALGHSGGAALAAMLAVRDTRATDPELGEYSSRVACAVDLAGQSDVSLPSPLSGEDDADAERLGGTPEEVPEAYRDVSPVAFVDEHSAPMLVIQGMDDIYNPVEQSRLLVAALNEAGVEVIYAELAGEDHFTIAEWERTGPLVLAFLDRQLRPAP